MPFPAHVRFADFAFDRYPRWGDVYWYDFGMPRAQQHTMAEPHLAIVVSDTNTTLKGTVLLVPLSGAEHRKEGYQFHVLITKANVPGWKKIPSPKWIRSTACLRAQAYPINTT